MYNQVAMPKSDYPQTVAVIGSGTFGAAISNLLARNTDVLLYSRNADLVQEINATHRIGEMVLSPNVMATYDLEEVAQRSSCFFR